MPLYNPSSVLPYTPSAVKSGNYSFAYPGAAVGANNTWGNGTLRVTPFWTSTGFTMNRIGGEITVIGDVGSTLRIGIYEDSTAGHYPGALLLDAGTIAGDSATVQDITISQVIAPYRLYWIGCALQGVTISQPTIRTSTTMMSTLVVGTSAPTTGATAVAAYSQTGVTGALPANFSASISLTSLIARLHFKAA